METEHPSSPLLHVDCLGHVYAENVPNALTSESRKKSKMKSCPDASSDVRRATEVEVHPTKCEAVGNESGDHIGECDLEVHRYRGCPIVVRILSIIPSSKVHTRNERQDEDAQHWFPGNFNL